MALIIPGPMAAVIRGSIGGTTFARNPAGDYVRNRTKPTYPATDVQAQRASQMATVVDTWQGLSVEQRNAWEAKRSTNTLTNAVGQQIVPSGFNLFTRANLSLLIASFNQVVDPPTPLVIDTPHFLIEWADTLGVQITNVYGWAPDYVDHFPFNWLPNQRQSINFHHGPFQKLTVADGSAVRAVPFTLIPNHLLLSDTRAFFRFKIVTQEGAVSMGWWQHADVGTIAP